MTDGIAPDPATKLTCTPLLLTRVMRSPALAVKITSPPPGKPSTKAYVPPGIGVAVVALVRVQMLSVAILTVGVGGALTERTKKVALYVPVLRTCMLVGPDGNANPELKISAPNWTTPASGIVSASRV